MEQHVVPSFTILNAVAAVIIALIYIALSSVLKEPTRQQVSAVIIAGAGAAYFRGGFGGAEMAFCTVMTFVAFKGLSNYTYIGLGWLLHTGWDILHHLYGNSIVPFDPSSSAGCAVCDTILALWFFWGAPNVFNLLRRTTATSR